jgi:hypothetical protein
MGKGSRKLLLYYDLKNGEWVRGFMEGYQKVWWWMQAEGATL